jgi:hypothetical protein
MTNDQPYRDALPVGHARAEIASKAGFHFDLRLAETFLGLGSASEPLPSSARSRLDLVPPRPPMADPALAHADVCTSVGSDFELAGHRRRSAVATTAAASTARSAAPGREVRPDSGYPTRRARSSEGRRSRLWPRPYSPADREDARLARLAPEAPGAQAGGKGA